MTNPAPEVAGLQAILPRLIELSSDERQKTAWRKMLADLPPLPIRKFNGKTIPLGLGDEASGLVSYNTKLVAGRYRFSAMWGTVNIVPNQDHGSVTMNAL